MKGLCSGRKFRYTIKGRPNGGSAGRMREALGSSPSRAMIFSSPVTFGGQCGAKCK